MKFSLSKIIIFINMLWMLNSFEIGAIGASACLFYQSPYDPSRPDPGYSGVTKCIVCRKGFVLNVDGFCHCPEGSYFNTNMSFSNIQCIVNGGNPNCIIGVYQSPNVKCSQCGNGYKLNLANYTCQCLGNLIEGGCTNIPFCQYVIYPTSTTQSCIVCSATFTLSQGKCICNNNSFDNLTKTCQSSSASATVSSNIQTSIYGCINAVNASYCSECAYGTILSNGTCNCNTFNVSGGCTNIPGCNYVFYPNPKTQQCISCKPTFILSQKICVCSANTYYNSTADICMTTSTTDNSTTSPTAAVLSNLSSNQSSNSHDLISINQLFIIVIVLVVIVIILFIFLLYSTKKYKKLVNPHFQHQQSLRVTQSGQNINVTLQKLQAPNKILNENNKLQIRNRRKKLNNLHDFQSYDIQQFSLHNSQIIT